MRAYLREHTNPPVFIISAVVVLTFLAVGTFFTEATGSAASAVQEFIVTYFGWFYTVSVSFFLIFVVALMFSRYGRVRLGPDDSRPEFSTLAWFAMLFTAGMGIGLVFFGVAEPILHLNEPPVGEGGTDAAAREAMNLTFFHWLLHPWAIYIVFGLSLAYFSFRRRLPLKPAAAFYPLIGERIHGPIGHLIDILAVFGTLFGLATSLGLGALQISSGLNTVFGIADDLLTWTILIAVITMVAAVSVVLGIVKGIRNLALINMWLAVGLALFVFLAGPTLFILDSLVGNIGYYLQNLVRTSFETFPFSESASEWQANYTLFYWGWWISWSPFVGMFIARISRGRTLREFTASVLLAPVGASAAWFTIFGGTAIHSVLVDGDNAVAEADPPNALFRLLEQLPVPGVLTIIASLIAILVVILFFATSSDSGSLVVDILTNGGDPNPLWQTRLFWAILEGAIAAVLLAAGAAIGARDQALSALQTASIVAGLPFCLVLLFMCLGLLKGLRHERLPSIIPEPATERFPPELGKSRSQGTPAPQQKSGVENPRDRER